MHEEQAEVGTEGVPTVELTNVRKSFGTVEVLKGISLRACKGDVISILGPSGSGKSTLLRCINMLEIPNSGSVCISGEEIVLRKARNGSEVASRQQLDRLRSKASMVFQSFNLWSHMTILENVIEAPVHVQKRNKRECIEEAESLLEKVGIAAKRNEYPINLSGGQQQRAAIARALAMRPDVLLFDEPTSSLDPELVSEVIAVMRSLAAERRTMLVVTHELGFARDVSTKVLFVHEGKIEDEGPPKELFAAPNSERFKRFISNQRS